MQPSARSPRARGLATLAAGAFAASTATASADVVPFVECVRPGPSSALVYFGYTNDGPQEFIAFGDQNQVVPGLGFQGQPETFNTGTYGRVFRAVWNQGAFSSISWELDGRTAVADGSSPACIAAATGPVSQLAPTSAVLHATAGTPGQATT